MNVLRRVLSGDADNFPARAVEAGDLPNVEAMLRRKPRLVDARLGKYDETPLHCASRVGQLEIARVLLKSGASIEARDGLGGTALHRAAYNGHDRIVELLVTSGAVVDVKGRPFRADSSVFRRRKGPR